MIFDVNVFRAQGLSLGGARPCNFEVYFPASPAVESNVNVVDSVVRCMTAQLPDARVRTIDVYYAGRAMKVAGEREYATWTARFYNEMDFGLRDFFEAWSNRIVTIVGNQAETTDFIDATLGGYKVDGVLVRQFSKQLSLLRTYAFYGMYPEIVGPIELNWENANRIETFDVIFAYDYWIPSTTGSGTSDQEQIFPGTYNVIGQNAPAGPGAIGLQLFGATLQSPQSTVAGAGGSATGPNLGGAARSQSASQQPGVIAVT